VWGPRAARAAGVGSNHPEQRRLGFNRCCLHSRWHPGTRCLARHAPPSPPTTSHTPNTFSPLPTPTRTDFTCNPDLHHEERYSYEHEHKMNMVGVASDKVGVCEWDFSIYRWRQDFIPGDILPVFDTTSIKLGSATGTCELPACLAMREPQTHTHPRTTHAPNATAPTARPTLSSSALEAARRLHSITTVTHLSLPPPTNDQATSTRMWTSATAPSAAA
jgi:hypothetical protein